MDSDILIGIAVCAVLILMYKDHTTRSNIFRVKMVKSSFDGRYYRVRTDHQNLKHAANTMAIVNSKLMQLREHLSNKYLLNGYDGTHPERYEIAHRISKMYNFKNLVENSPHNSDNSTSYTIGKGDIIAICIREKNNTAYIHEIHTITFVAIHELAHIATTLMHHPDGFWSVFKFLLTECSAAGIYTSTNYSRFPEQYCGMKISYNPIYDATIEPIP